MSNAVINEQRRKRYAEDPEYRQRCKERVREYRRSPAGREGIGRTEEKRREGRRREKNEYMRKYRKQSVVRVHEKIRRKNPMIRIYRNLDKLARRKAGKLCDRFLILLGCSRLELIRHIERQFRPGMTWANYGVWEIDHIRPYASFDLTDPAQQRKCFHYTNLQPLWAEENVAKGVTPPAPQVIHYSPDECPPECPEGCADCVAW